MKSCKNTNQNKTNINKIIEQFGLFNYGYFLVHIKKPHKNLSFGCYLIIVVYIELLKTEKDKNWYFVYEGRKTIFRCTR